MVYHRKEHCRVVLKNINSVSLKLNLYHGDVGALVRKSDHTSWTCQRMFIDTYSLRSQMLGVLKSRKLTHVIMGTG